MTILPTSNQEAASVPCSSLPWSSPSLRAQPPSWNFSFTFLSNLPLIEAQFWELQAFRSGHIIWRPAAMANSSPLAGITFQWTVLFWAMTLRKLFLPSCDSLLNWRECLLGDPEGIPGKKREDGRARDSPFQAALMGWKRGLGRNQFQSIYASPTVYCVHFHVGRSWTMGLAKETPSSLALTFSRTREAKVLMEAHIQHLSPSPVQVHSAS